MAGFADCGDSSVEFGVLCLTKVIIKGLLGKISTGIVLVALVEIVFCGLLCIIVVFKDG